LLLKPTIAGLGSKDARRVAEGGDQNIGDFKKSVPRELKEALNFTFSLARDSDPDSRLLVFQFIQENGISSFICYGVQDRRGIFTGVLDDLAQRPFDRAAQDANVDRPAFDSWRRISLRSRCEPSGEFGTERSRIAQESVVSDDH
jgi:hypothetical protein